MLRYYSSSWHNATLHDTRNARHKRASAQPVVHHDAQRACVMSPHHWRWRFKQPVKALRSKPSSQTGQAAPKPSHAAQSTQTGTWQAIPNKSLRHKRSASLQPGAVLLHTAQHHVPRTAGDSQAQHPPPPSGPRLRDDKQRAAWLVMHIVGTESRTPGSPSARRPTPFKHTLAGLAPRQSVDVGPSSSSSMICTSRQHASSVLGGHGGLLCGHVAVHLDHLLQHGALAGAALSVAHLSAAVEVPHLWDEEGAVGAAAAAASGEWQ